MRTSSVVTRSRSVGLHLCPGIPYTVRLLTQLELYLIIFLGMALAFLGAAASAEPSVSAVGAQID